jgi:hypothetical protein
MFFFKAWLYGFYNLRSAEIVAPQWLQKASGSFEGSGYPENRMAEIPVQIN